MRLSVETYAIRERFDDRTAIKMIQDAGFDAYDYSMYWARGDRNMLAADYRERAKALRAYADELGFRCNQAHAPVNFREKDEMSLSNERYCRLIRSIETASILGAENIIVHAISDDSADREEQLAYNRRFYRSLEPYCREFGIRVSVENLYHLLNNPQEHMDFVRSLNSEWFNICVDIGHYTISGHLPENCIRKFDSSLLRSVHIHDNDFVSDRHLMPYSGNMNWEDITRAFAAIGYDQDITLEIFGSVGNLDDRLLGPSLCYAEKIGRVLIDKITERRQ